MGGAPTVRPEGHLGTGWMLFRSRGGTVTHGAVGCRGVTGRLHPWAPHPVLQHAQQLRAEQEALR